MTYDEMVYSAARGAVNLTQEIPDPDHDMSTEQGFRESFDELVTIAYRPEFAADVRDQERTQGMISSLFH